MTDFAIYYFCLHCVGGSWNGIAQDLNGLFTLWFSNWHKDIPRLSIAQANGFISCFELASAVYDLLYLTQYTMGKDFPINVSASGRNKGLF